MRKLLNGVVRRGEGFFITTIIAKREANGTVTLGADSLSSGGTGNTSSSKLTEINEQFWIGVAGRTRYSNVLGYISVPSIHKSDYSDPNFDVRGYLITKVVPAWVDGLKDSFGEIPEQKEDWPDGVILVAIKGRIFEVCWDFTVTESLGDAWGIGSGSPYALGAIAAGKSVEKALEIAADLDPYTGGELVVKKGLK